MNFINIISNYSIPIIILLIVGICFFEKNNVFDDFTEGVKEGVKIIYNVFPTLLGLFVAIGFLKTSGLLDFIIKLIMPMIELVKIPKEILPLMVFKPVSGSAATAIATEIMRENGVDSLIGKTASVIMGSTETTLYTIAIYTGCVKIKKTRGILLAALAGDFIGMLVSIVICRFMW